VRNSFIILLVLAFLFEIGGTVFIFKTRQYVIKKEIKSKIKGGVPENELIVFTFNEMELAALKWKHEREFSLGSMMYDIVKRKTDENGNHVLYCVSDEQESTLFVQLNALLGKKMSQNMPFQQPFKQLVRIFTIPLPPIFQLSIPHPLETNSSAFPAVCMVVKGFPEVLLPPPKLN
jgi:hypothetical protein